ncbi:MAG: hypothetical protein C4K49_00100 [Candidatus Thorarchaeota archaeon]|nr:MAG: hypothetical protein C4K49_00100 [Candidatus Thorarchaeota archaeon]
MDYSSLKRSELFTFFHIVEVSRLKASVDGLTRVSLKPGGFQEFIDIEVGIDEASLLRFMTLIMDRHWVGDVCSVNPFAKDITKTFMATVFPEEDLPLAKDIIDGIWNLTGASDKVYHLKQPTEVEESYDPQVVLAQRVYLGEKDRFDMLMPSSELIIENTTVGTKQILRLTIDTF